MSRLSLNNVFHRVPISRTLSSMSNVPKATKPFDAIPGPKPLPLIGNIWRYLPLIGDYKVDQLYANAQLNRRRYGPIVREQITSKHTILHLFDPTDIETFFRLDGKEPHRRSHRALLKYRRDRPELYNDGGLFPENGASWSRLRKLFQHYLMKKTQISQRARILDEVTLDSINKLNDYKICENFEEFLYDWSIECSLAVFLDYRANDMPDAHQLQSLVASLHHELDAIDGTEIKSERWSRQPQKCPFFQKLSQAESSLHDFVTRRVNHLIDTKFAHVNEEVSFARDWLQRDKLDRKDVVTFILDCILAGLHTTAYTTTFLLNHISLWHADGREQLHREVRAQMPPASELLERDMSDQMPVLKDCLRETLRLRPVSIGTGRLTQGEMVIRDFHIPPDVMVIAHNQTVCMDGSIYEQPELFRPKRWAEYRSRSKRHERPSAFAWLPYGFGPRSCIGQRLITLQIHILAARMMQQFQWKFLGPIETKSMLVHTLEGKVRVQLDRPQI